MEDHRRSSGSVAHQVLALLVLAGVVGGFLTWSFQDKKEFRPFAGYSDEQLQELVAAHGDELAERDERYQAIASRPVDVQDHAMLGEKVREFERIQQLSRRTREAGEQVSFVMSAQDDLERELWIRKHPIRFFWQTATAF